eukprot:13055566-Heterocapsa_arctica.AAC.1
MVGVKDVATQWKGGGPIVRTDGYREGVRRGGLASAGRGSIGRVLAGRRARGGKGEGGSRGVRGELTDRGLGLSSGGGTVAVFAPK